MTDQPTPSALLTERAELEEAAAKIVYDAMRWAREAAHPVHKVPDWVERGNSTAQEEARAAVRRVISAIAQSAEKGDEREAVPFGYVTSDDPSDFITASALDEGALWQHEHYTIPLYAHPPAVHATAGSGVRCPECDFGIGGHEPDCPASQDSRAELEARVERLTQERDDARAGRWIGDTEQHARDLTSGLEQWMAQAKTEARRATELEAALRQIAEGNLGDAPWQANYHRIREVARAALAGDAASQEGQS